MAPKATYTTLLLCSLILSLSLLSTAYTVPQKIPVQGRLTNASTGVVLSGEYNFTFRIYNASTSGALLWDENQTLTVDGNGLWNTLLGNNTALSLNFSEDTYLEVELNHDGNPLPRVQLGSTPYAEWTDTASNLSCTDCLGTNEIEDVYLLNTGDNATGDYMFNGSFKVENSSGSAVLYANSSNGNVGIGTTSPGAKLHVSGGDVHIYDYASSSGFRGYRAGGTQSSPTAVESDLILAELVGYGYDGSVYKGGGAVTIKSNEAHSSGHYGTRLEFYTTPDTTDTYWYNQASRMVIQNDGYVGIGTTDPTSQLHIVGSLGKITVERPDSNPYVQLVRTGTSGNNTMGYLAFIAPNSASENLTYSYLRGIVTDDTDSSEDGAIAFNTYAAGSSVETMRMVSGNVGIGTTTPQELLHLLSTGDQSLLKIETQSASDFSGVCTKSDTGKMLYLLSLGASFSGTIFGSNRADTCEIYSFGQPLIIGAYSDYPLIFGQNNLEVMRISDDGYVGIGTTAPYSNLNIQDGQFTTAYDNYKGIYLQSSAFSSGTFSPALTFGYGGSPKSAIAGTFETTDNDQMGIAFFVHSSGSSSAALEEAMRIDENGYVGVGTTSPETRLNLETGTLQVGMAADSYFSFLTANMLAFNYAGNSYIDQRKVSGNILFRMSSAGTVDTNAMIILSNGNVGIGTTSPNDALDVVGDIDATGCVQTDDSGSIGGTCISDVRLKTNIQPLEGSLDRISQLNPVSFQWDPDQYNISSEEGMGVGLIAQELEEVYPELVVTGVDGYKRVRYDIELEMHLIQAVKELKEEDERKDAEMGQLREENEALQAENAAQQEEMGQLKALVCSDHPDSDFCRGVSEV